MPGDVILSVNGKHIHEIAADMLHYVSYPNNERANF